jgi:hypothetical protein
MDKQTEIEKIFTLPDLMYLYEEMRTLGFNTEKVAAEFQKDYIQNDIKIPESNYFVQYGLRVIQPMLNERLNRPHDHPTFYNLIKHIQERKRK